MHLFFYRRYFSISFSNFFLFFSFFFCSILPFFIFFLFYWALSCFFFFFFSLFAQFNILSFSAIIMGLKPVPVVLLWLLMGGLSVFFNQALLILFFELNTPIKNEQALGENKIVPVPSI